MRGHGKATLSIRTEESDENVEYLAAENSVRFVATLRSGDSPGDRGPPEPEPVYETMSFENWAKKECVSTAARAGAEYVNDRLETDEVSSSVSSSIDDGSRAALLKIETLRDRDGAVVSEPDVSLDDLASAAPRTIEATYVLGGREHTMAVPVYVTRETLTQQ